MNLKLELLLGCIVIPIFYPPNIHHSHHEILEEESGSAEDNGYLSQLRNLTNDQSTTVYFVQRCAEEVWMTREIILNTK